jgi:glycerol-3-phosphate cytidylyltransferase
MRRNNNDTNIKNPRTLNAAGVDKKLSTTIKSTTTTAAAELTLLFENDMSCFFYKKDKDEENDVVVEGGGGGKNYELCGGYYLPTVGMTNCKLNEDNELKRDQATIYFRILDRYNVQYAVFAGSSIGLLRNGKTIPWSDDYDVVVLNSDLKLLFNIFPIFRKHGFKIIKNKNKFTNEYTNGGCSIVSNIHKYAHVNQGSGGDQDQDQEHKRSLFACDIFYSYFDKKGFLRNSGLWGLYHVKNLHIQDVMPFRRRVFDGIPLPFFNNVNSEVYKTYGKTDEAIIQTHFQKDSCKYATWRSAYDEFENKKMKAIQNTTNKIYKNNNNKTINNENTSSDNKSNVMKVMDNKFTKNQVELLSEIGEKEIGRIYVFSVDFIIQHAACIKYYFPNVVIEYFSYAREVEVILYLNYVDKLHVYNSFIEKFYDDPDIIYLNKPKIDIIKVITFGTFDMWHVGHSNLLSRCCKYSENICAGVSSDEFTFQKKQIHPTDSFKTRSENVKRCKFVKRVFEETSMELKNDYIKNYSANILIMGDDWQDKFDWVDCCVIYLPRTPNISSTMLREQMNVKFA